MPFYRYECRKCGHQFEKPDSINHTFGSGHVVQYNVCPLCKTRSIVEMWCSTCDYYKQRAFPCGMGHRTITPFNVCCCGWKIRGKDKPKVI